MADKDPAISLSFKFPGVKLMEFREKDALKTRIYLNDTGTEGTEPLMSPTVQWCLQKVIKEPLRYCQARLVATGTTLAFPFIHSLNVSHPSHS